MRRHSWFVIWLGSTWLPMRRSILSRIYEILESCAGSLTAHLRLCTDLSTNVIALVVTWFVVRIIFMKMYSAKEGYITTFQVISRIVYPRLAFWTFECNVVPSSSTIPASFTVWRDIMVKFVKIRAEIGNMSELMNIFKVWLSLLFQLWSHCWFSLHKLFDFHIVNVVNNCACVN